VHHRVPPCLLLHFPALRGALEPMMSPSGYCCTLAGHCRPPFRITVCHSEGIDR
jgi:hypothetical protein